jgi:DNA-binding CsgD family transcriptional regulator
MGEDKELIAQIDLIYEAVLQSDLWSAVLIKLAGALGVVQIAMPSADRRANIATAIAPHLDPDLLASFKEYWAFRDPVFGRAILRSAGEIYTLDSLMPREEFAATPVFNELWRPAKWGFATAFASLVAEDQFSALVCISNVPGKDFLTEVQLRHFEVVARHLGRAVRINRQLWKLELKHLAQTELDTLSPCVLLVDASERVVLANAAAKAMLDAHNGIFLCNGRLAVAGRPDALHKLVASCARRSLEFDGPGGELEVARDRPRSPLQLTVAPLRSNARLPDLPWIGFGSPVAIVTVIDRDLDGRRRQENLCRRFDLTSREAAFAAEILRGDGRKAAARRCGIEDETAKSHLRNIFEKTGTHRQAELVSLLLGVADAREMKT